jgi:hypothetical protein
MDFEVMMRGNLELLKELKPGEPGTEELLERFGDALVCVRHWYDPERDLELTTAEVVETRRPRWLRRHPGKMLEPRSPRRSG